MKKFRRIMAVLCALVMAVVMCVPGTQVYAEKDSAAIESAKEGVVLIQLVYVDAAGNATTIQTGTGFLIDESYVITCYHVVHMDDETKELATQLLGVDFVNSEPSGLQVQLVVRGTSTIDLSETSANSSTADFSVLKLEEPIYNRTCLALGDSTELNSSENVYALGFPDFADAFQDAQFYSSDEVNVESGTITKIVEENNMKYIQHSATLSYGNSGGPLLNDDGVVIGINMSVITSTDNSLTTYTYRAIGISEITTYLDDYGIPYIDGSDGSTTSNSSDDEEPEDSEDDSQDTVVAETVDKSDLSDTINTAKALDEDKYTEDSYEKLESALESAQSVYDNSEATQAEVDSARTELSSAISSLEEAGSGISMTVLIIIIVAVVVVIIIVIVIIAVSSSSKKKKAKQQARPQQARPYPPQQPGQQPPFQAPPVQPQSPYGQPQQPQSPYGQQPPFQAPPVQPQRTSYTAPVQPEGAGETTVLNSGAGETTVLGGQPAALLRRVKTGENIAVNKQMFTIGKERRRVDYCISDNTSISRSHVQIVCRGGEYYVVDQGSTNFTFVNGNKIAAHQEVKLNSGDKLKLADEEFEFRI